MFSLVVAAAVAGATVGGLSAGGGLNSMRVDSTAAPTTPTAAPTTPTSAPIRSPTARVVLYASANLATNGNFGGYAGATARCAASPVLGQNVVVFAANWSEAISTLTSELGGTGLLETHAYSGRPVADGFFRHQNFWFGTNATGEYVSSCDDWTSSGTTGVVGAPQTSQDPVTPCNWNLTILCGCLTSTPNVTAPSGSLALRYGDAPDGSSENMIASCAIDPCPGGNVLAADFNASHRLVDFPTVYGFSPSAPVFDSTGLVRFAAWTDVFENYAILDTEDYDVWSGTNGSFTCDQWTNVSAVGTTHQFGTTFGFSSKSCDEGNQAECLCLGTA